MYHTIHLITEDPWITEDILQREGNHIDSSGVFGGESSLVYSYSLLYQLTRNPEYLKYAEMLKEMIKQGFSAAVYTQTTDVEVEVNGLMTYDRKAIKIEEERVREINKKICNSLSAE
mgnify:CR=1 FL=1